MYKKLPLKDIKLKIKQEQKDKSELNNFKLKEYYEDFIRKINEKPFSKLEKKICYLIGLGISKEYIANIFNISMKSVENMAIANKMNSVLLKKYETTSDDRCFSKKQILKACEFYNFICPLCFKPLDIRNLSNITGHHILPYSQGGKTDIDNCLPLHIECHYLDFEKLHGLHNVNNRIYTKQKLDEIMELFKNDHGGIDYLLSFI
ncbi:MAG: HNH endonuclease [Rickettsiales bacterium]|jgi:hypothetical protein|nr:HNH endonuclease [Rickettsiales bacterium]